MFAISAILIFQDQALGCIGKVVSFRTVKNKSKTFSSRCVIPIIKNEEESFNEIFKAPPKLVVSSSEDEKAPVSEPL